MSFISSIASSVGLRRPRRQSSTPLCGLTPQHVGAGFDDEADARLQPERIHVPPLSILPDVDLGGRNGILASLAGHVALDDLGAHPQATEVEPPAARHHGHITRRRTRHRALARPVLCHLLCHFPCRGWFVMPCAGERPSVMWLWDRLARPGGTRGRATSPG